MIRKLLSWLVILLSALVSIALLIYPTKIIWVSVVIGVIIMWTLMTIFIKRKFRLSTLNYITTPVFLWISTYTSILFTEIGVGQYVLIFIATVLSGLWLLTLNYTLNDKRWLIFRGNLLSYINSFILFFTASSLYAGMVVIEFPLLISIIIILPLLYLLFMQVMLASHLTWRFGSLFAIISMIVIGEIFIALTVLPTSYWVKGLLVTISFYIVTGLSRCELTSIISSALIRRYVMWGFGIIVLILLSAPWQ